MIWISRSNGTAVALFAVMLLTGCGSDAVEVPQTLLSAKTVDGTAIGEAERNLDGNAGFSRGTAEEQCQLDTINFLIGASDRDAMAYRRTVDGHRETIVIAVTDRTEVMFETARDNLEDGLGGVGCQRPPTIVATSVDLGIDGTLAISSQRMIKKTKESILRSYTYVQVNGSDKQVLVSIERTDGTKPAVSDLKKLTTAQLAKTTSVLS